MKKLIFTLLLSSPVFANELTLYVVPTAGIDWSSPKNLLVSSAKKSFSSNSMGLSWIELNCGTVKEAAGVVGDSPDFFTKVVLEQRGLGVLYTSFKGKFLSRDEMTSNRSEYSKNGGMNFVRFLLNNDQCKRVSEYLFQFRRNHVVRNYGLAHRPRHGEGSSSVSFAVSAVDVLNILDQDMKESWMETVKVPLDLAGAPVRDESVGVFTLLGADSWAKDGDKFQELKFWNPDRIYKWVNDKAAKPMAGYSLVKTEKLTGILLDKTHFPVPQEPIWMQQLDPGNRKRTAVLIDSTRPPKKNIPAP